MRIPVNEVRGWNCSSHYFFVCWAGLLLSCLLMANAQATYTPQSRMDALDLPDATWDASLALQVSDTPLYVRSFSSSRQPVLLAKELARNNDIFQRILTGKHNIVLSGFQPGWHWLAQIDATSEGAKGYVSALYIEAERLTPSAHNTAPSGWPDGAGSSLYSWLPTSARRRFSHRTVAFPQVLTQQIFSIPMPVDRLLGDVAVRLGSQGWQPETQAQQYGGPHVWTHAGQILTLFAYPGTQGTSVLVHHIQQSVDGNEG